jgi:hypothetical protein
VHPDFSAAPPDLVQAAEGMRAVYADALQMHLGKVQTAGSCLYAAILMRTAITQWLERYTAHIRGGDGAGDGGVFTEGRGHGHYWVEVEVDNTAWVLDISGDQFGFPPVNLRPALELGGSYVPGDQSVVDDHVEQLMAEMREAGRSLESGDGGETAD